MPEYVPTEEQIRGPRGAGGHRIIFWELVDPWLRKCVSVPGWLGWLARRWKMDRKALYRRRKALGIENGAKGRPPVVTLTPLEKLTVNKIAEGLLQSELADALGVTPATISKALEQVRSKARMKRELACSTCGGAGVVPCSSCTTFGGGTATHHHVCLDCGGNSTFWASEGMDKR